jgi:hypothetical protein
MTRPVHASKPRLHHHKHHHVAVHEAGYHHTPPSMPANHDGTQVTGLAHTNINSHICTSYSILGGQFTKTKNLQHKCCAECEVNLLLRWYFKRLSVCDEFVKICLKLKTRNLWFTANKTRNRLSDLFHV